MVCSKMALMERVFKRLLRGQHTFKALTLELEEGETEQDLRSALRWLEVAGEAKRIPGRLERWSANTLLGRC